MIWCHGSTMLIHNRSLNQLTEHIKSSSAANTQPSGFGSAAATVAASVIYKQLGTRREFDCGIVLGSGLGGLAASISDAVRIPFAQVPGFPSVTVAGHDGQVIIGSLGGRQVVALSGRFHMYEGHSASVAAFPVRVLHALGVKTFIASNAAGGVNRSFSAGDLMVIGDHINLTGRNPLVGTLEPSDERFPDMSEAYDATLRKLLHKVAKELGIPLHEGVYCGLLGPCYETPAEVRMLERLGADAVGMSTVPEVIVARALGMRIAAVSCITNKAAGLGSQRLSHAEVMEIGRASAAKFQSLITALVAQLPAVA